MALVVGTRGGAQKASVGTTEVAVDLSALVGREVLVWSDDDDLWFAFAPDNTNTTLVISGDSSASLTSMKAQRAGKGVAVKRVVTALAPWIVARHATLTGTVHVAVVSLGVF